MSREINKHLVKRQFHSGLHTYDAHAIVQKTIAEKLVRAICDSGCSRFENAFEFGCGTGFLTSALLNELTVDHLLINDMAVSAQQHIRAVAVQYKRELPFLLGDVENINWPMQLDAVFSSSTLQWVTDLSSLFYKAGRSLCSNGILAFSTFGSQNFKEIRQLCGVGLEYYSVQELRELLFEDFDVLFEIEWEEVLEFVEPVDVLRHMKHTGVNGLKQVSWTRSKLQSFSDDYARYYSLPNAKCSLSYHPIIMVARRK